MVKIDFIWKLNMILNEDKLAKQINKKIQESQFSCGYYIPVVIATYSKLRTYLIRFTVTRMTRVLVKQAKTFIPNKGSSSMD